MMTLTVIPQLLTQWLLSDGYYCHSLQIEKLELEKGKGLSKVVQQDQWFSLDSNVCPILPYRPLELGGTFQALTLPSKTSY